MPAPPEHAVAESHIIARVHASVLDVDPQAWNALLAQQVHATPFMRHEYLAALETSGSATPRTGWTPRFLTLWDAGVLVAACPLYLKTHSYGEYVFDWAWASAYEQHGVPYYPKALVAVPFTPVPGSRLLARDATARAQLVQAAFVSLLGVSVMDGILILSYFKELRLAGQSAEDAIYEAYIHRMRPLLMTALSACIGLFPAALSHGIGSQVQRPLATVVVGGLVTATALTLVLLPALYYLIEQRMKKEAA